MAHQHSRRDFIKKLSGTVAALSLTTEIASATTPLFIPSGVHILKSAISSSANDKIRIGLIGSGIIGHYDTDTALSLPGIELAAVCDLYDGRLIRAKEKWGKDIFTTRDYREILARKDIDAILVCTPDHWHDRISIDAMNAGKHVYCEKPMVQKIELGHAVINTQKKTGKAFQVGSQRASSVAVAKAKELFEQGVIGELTLVEAVNNRSDARGAWQYSIPTDASPQTVDFDRFLNKAPKVPFDANRFFRWRNYKDYGTGVAGDLFVHLVTMLHTTTSSFGPTRIFSLGDLNYWKDGRDAYDLVSGIMDYPKTDKHPSFQFITRVNLADGAGGGSYFRMIGTEGVIEINGNNLKMRRFKRPTAPGYGGYDAYESFSAIQKDEFKKWYDDKYKGLSTDWQRDNEVSFDAEKGYDDRKQHMAYFFESVRTGKAVFEDASFGLRAAGPSIACNLSADLKKPINWDPIKMKILK